MSAEGFRIFIRDDDVGALSGPLQSFAADVAERGLPVSYQIIPERLTPECAAFLLEQKRCDTGRIEFGQHGLRHQMWVRGKLLNHEFGPERTFDQQFADIQAGKAILRAHLGEDADLRVFTPPRHRYNRATLKAIKAAAFPVLSASSYTTLVHRVAYAFGRAGGLTNLGKPGVPHHGRVRPDSGLFELSVAVGADDGHVLLGSAEAIVDRVRQAAAHTRNVGILFHHDVFSTPDLRDFVRRVLDGLMSIPDARFMTIGGLYDELNPRT